MAAHTACRLHGILIRDIWWEGGIQRIAHVNRKQNRVGSPAFWSVEEVANGITFACNRIKHESLGCMDRSAMPRSIAMDAHCEGGLRTVTG